MMSAEKVQVPTSGLTSMASRAGPRVSSFQKPRLSSTMKSRCPD